MDLYSNNELLNYDVITSTVLTVTALLYFHTPDEPSGETICCVIKPCFNILYHRFYYYHLLYQFRY